MNKGITNIALTIFAAIFLLSACSMNPQAISLTDAKIVTAVDEKLMPVRITDVFPRGTQKVSCWIKWRNARVNEQILAKWHYVTDDIHILDYTFNIPKKEGAGSVALSMPSGKTLPSGKYKLDLVLGRHVLRTLRFTIE